MENGFVVLDNMKNGKAYGGNIDKFGITVNNECYIVKQCEYKSGIYSEYVASRFIGMTEVPVQLVWIGYYGDEEVAIIKDFTSKDRKLKSFESTRQSSEGTSLRGKEYTYEDVCDMIMKHTKMSDNTKRDMLKHFWRMYILDAILGNRDRHRGNWGYIDTGNGYEPVPLYDKEGSLFPDVERKMNEYRNVIGTQYEEKFITERAEKFPASLFRVRIDENRTRRSNYYEEIGNINSGVQLEVLNNVRKNVTLEKIVGMIQDIVSIEEIPDEYKRFYGLIVGTRYAHIMQRKSLERSFKETRRILENG